MDKAIELYENLLLISRRVGEIKSTHLYDSDFIKIDGECEDGKTFTLSFRKEEKNA